MAPRIPSTWFSNGCEAMVPVVERLALQASRAEKEQFFDGVANGFFSRRRPETPMAYC